MFHPALYIAQVTISLFFVLAGMGAEGKPEPGGIISNTYLFCICMGGSGMGSALYIAFNAISFKVQESSAIRIVKFLCSFIIGGIVTPYIIRKWHMDESAESVLALSAGVGLVGWSVVMTLLPWAVSFIPNLVKSRAGDSSSTK